MERNRNFPQNYTESSHRREWFQEKFGDQGEEEAESGPASETPVERMETVTEAVTEEVTEEVTQVEVLSDQPDSEDEVMSLEVENDNNEDTIASDVKDDKMHVPEDSSRQRDNSETVVEPQEDEVQGAVGGQVEDSVEPNLASDYTPIGAKRSFDYLNETVKVSCRILTVINQSNLDLCLLVTKQSEKICQPWSGLS